MQKRKFLRVILFLAIGVLISSMLFGCQSSITSNGAGQKAENYLNEHFLTEKTGMKGLKAKYTKVESKGDFFVVSLDINKDDKKQHQYNVYVTKAGNNILLNPDSMYIYDISRSPKEAFEAEKKKQEAKALKSIPKKDKSKIDLFVMSACPFGLQAEDTFAKVVKHFGTNEMLDMHFISLPGKGKNCFKGHCAMHGKEEAVENTRQLCIWKNQQDKFWAYIEKYNKDCAKSQSESCSKKTAKATGVDYTKVQSCLDSSDALLKSENDLITKYKANASPTIIINGVAYTGGRTPNDIVKAICAGYKKQPEACKKQISAKDGGDKKVAATGGCKVE